MSYLVLARKYRPQTFSEVVGQEHVTRTLANAFSQDRVHHAFLFCGPRGCGKTTTARILGKALNCDQGPTGEPCGVCSACTSIADGSAVDYFEMDGASNRGIDAIRELTDAVRYQPAVLRKKVYVIDEVHMLTAEAFNALLKTLEEPPPHVTFVLATTEPHKLPNTILSRCQRYDFKLVPTARLTEYLASILGRESIEAEAGAVNLLVRESGGSVRDALSLADQIISYVGGEAIAETTVAEILGVADRALTRALVTALAGGDARSALEAADGGAGRGVDEVQLARAIVRYLRDLAVTHVAPDSDKLVDGTAEERAELAELSRVIDRLRVKQMFERMLRACEDLAETQQPRLVLDLALIDVATQEPMVPLGDLLDRLGDLERRLGGAAGSRGGSRSGGSSSSSSSSGGGRAPASGGGRASAAQASPSSATHVSSASPSPATHASPAPHAPHATHASPSSASSASAAAPSHASNASASSHAPASNGSASSPASPSASPASNGSTSSQGSHASASSPASPSASPASNGSRSSQGSHAPSQGSHASASSHAPSQGSHASASSHAPSHAAPPSTASNGAATNGHATASNASPASADEPPFESAPGGPRLTASEASAALGAAMAALADTRQAPPPNVPVELARSAGAPELSRPDVARPRGPSPRREPDFDEPPSIAHGSRAATPPSPSPIPGAPKDPLAAWEKVVSALDEAREISLITTYQSAKVLAWTERGVEVGFPMDGLTSEIAASKEKIASMTAFLERFVGRPVDFSVRLLGPEEEAAARSILEEAAQRADEERERRRLEAQEHPMTRVVLDTFGATIKEIKTDV